MMEMLGAITGLIGAGLQYQAQQEAKQIAQANLIFQRNQAMRNNRFSEAGRTDALGNRTGYDAATNEWLTKLSPQQQRISDASQKEQLTQLLEDIPAARKIKQAVQARSKEAAPLYHQALQGYLYDQPRSEKALRSEILGDTAVDEMIKAKADQANITRAAMRMGTKSEDLQLLAKTIDERIGGKEAMQRRSQDARARAMEEYSKRLGQHEQQWGKPLSVFAELMEKGGDMPQAPKLSFGNLDNQLSNQAAQMGQANRANAESMGQAYNALANVAGKSPDLGSIAKILASIGNQQNKQHNTQSDTYTPDTTTWGGTTTVSGGAIDDRDDQGW